MSSISGVSSRLFYKFLFKSGKGLSEKLGIETGKSFEQGVQELKETIHQKLEQDTFKLGEIVEAQHNQIGEKLEEIVKDSRALEGQQERTAVQAKLSDAMFAETMQNAEKDVQEVTDHLFKLKEAEASPQKLEEAQEKVEYAKRHLEQVKQQQQVRETEKELAAKQLETLEQKVAQAHLSESVFAETMQSAEKDVQTLNEHLDNLKEAGAAPKTLEETQEKLEYAKRHLDHVKQQKQVQEKEKELAAKLQTLRDAQADVDQNFAQIKTRQEKDTLDKMTEKALDGLKFESHTLLGRQLKNGGQYADIKTQTLKQADGKIDPGVRIKLSSRGDLPIPDYVTRAYKLKSLAEGIFDERSEFVATPKALKGNFESIEAALAKHAKVLEAVKPREEELREIQKVVPEINFQVDNQAARIKVANHPKAGNLRARFPLGNDLAQIQPTVDHAINQTNRLAQVLQPEDVSFYISHKILRKNPITRNLSEDGLKFMEDVKKELQFKIEDLQELRAQGTRIKVLSENQIKITREDFDTVLKTRRVKRQENQSLAAFITESILKAKDVSTMDLSERSRTKRFKQWFKNTSRPIKKGVLNYVG
jgi:hypothetical protein